MAKATWVAGDEEGDGDGGRSGGEGDDVNDDKENNDDNLERRGSNLGVGVQIDYAKVDFTMVSFSFYNLYSNLLRCSGSLCTIPKV